jgi:tRNA(fMet)-specific endonuclease VapC
VTRSGNDLLLLDTSVFVHLARNDATGALLLSEYGLEERAERPLFSTVSEGEVLAISRWRKWGGAKQDRLGDLLAELVRIDAGLHEVVDAYADLHAESVTRGLNIGENDMWIAASAKAAGAVVLTCDTDFKRVPDAFVRVEYVAQIK